MKQLHTQIEIDAPAKRVWEVLTDFASYPQWNPFIRHIRGRLAAGERLRARLAPPGGRAMTFKPKVLTAAPERELRWVGHLLLPGLFDGEHSFLIETLEENRVRFVQREAFDGLLVPLFSRSLESNTQRGFEQMNQALKERAEAGSPAQD